MLSPEGNQRGEGSSREGGFPESQSPPKGVFQCGVFRCTSVGGGEGVGGAERDRASSDSKRGIGKFVFSTALYLLSNIFPGKRQHFLGQSHGKLSVPPCDLRRGCWGCLWSHGGREGPPGPVNGWREVEQQGIPTGSPSPAARGGLGFISTEHPAAGSRCECVTGLNTAQYKGLIMVCPLASSSARHPIAEFTANSVCDRTTRDNRGRRVRVTLRNLQGRHLSR